MKRPISNNIGIKAVLVVIALMLFSNLKAFSYCDMLSMYGAYGYGMAVSIVKFDGKTMQKWDVPRKGGNILYGEVPYWYGYKTYDDANTIPMVERGKSYSMEVYGGGMSIEYDASNSIDEYATFNSWYCQDFKVYIDFNQDNTFQSSELAGQWNDESGSTKGGKFNISVPSSAKPGRTTMRIVSDYWANNGGWGPYDACNSQYGEARDYYIDVKGAADVGMSKFTAPVALLSEGVQTVKATLKNYCDAVITKCTIKWSVDGVAQTQVDWTGNLPAYGEVEVTLGTYDFKSKGIKTSYTLLANTEKPNGEVDEVTSNDGTPSYVLSFPIKPGTYYVGGVGYDFEKLIDVTDLLNTTGVTGDGDFIVRIRPGTYTGPFTMNDFKHGKNNFIFELDPGNPGTVVINAPTNASNYVWYINNIPNVMFRNLTFSVTNPLNYGGRIFMIRSNADNYSFENCIFNGVTNFSQTNFQFSMIDMQANQMNNLRFVKNTFNDGFLSMALINPNRTASGLTIENNKFNSFSGRAIQVEGIANGFINKNTLKASSISSFAGIVVYNGTEVVNNTISGIMGLNGMSSGIVVSHNAVSAPGIVNNNIISNCSNIIGINVIGVTGGEVNKNTINIGNTNLTSPVSGIAISSPTTKPEKVFVSENAINVDNGYGLDIDNMTTDILRNKVVITNSGAKVNLTGVSATNANGWLLMNEIISNGEVINASNSNLTMAYNSTLALGATHNLILNGGSNKVYRNQLVNQGIGYVFNIDPASAAKLDGNNYIANNGLLGLIQGNMYSNLSQMTAVDNNARSTDPKYVSTSSLKITEFKDELVFYTPLQNMNWPDTYQNFYEETTLDGKARNGAFYIGAYNIFPVVDIIKYSKELIGCAGAEDMYIICSGKANLGAQPKYQWYKDGVELVGETSHKLSFPDFDYPTSGIYKCKVFAPGVPKPLWSGDIPVYALTTPEITEQPKEVINAELGGSYNFDVKAHYRGIVPPYYEHSFQWYKFTAADNKLTALTNSAKFQGTTASKFVITGLEADDICNKGDYYFVEIISQCGTVRSNPFIISQKPEVVFRDNPKDVEVCPNNDVVFNAFAVAPEGFKVTYLWQKDGVDLADNTKFNGTTTAKLQIFDANEADAGLFTCKATIESEGISEMSSAGKLSFKLVPEAKAIGDLDVSIKRGNDAIFKVELVKATHPVNVVWTYKGEVLKEGVWDIYSGTELLTLTLEAINENQAGEYVCKLTNECDFTEIKFNLTVKKWDEANSVDVVTENGYSLYSAVPNPATDKTRINYIMPKAGNVTFTLSDLSGKVIRTLHSSYAQEGTNTLEVNIKQLDLPSGVYFYTMSADNFSGVRTLVIVE